MENYIGWYEEIAAGIRDLREKAGINTAKKLKLEYLDCLARRIAFYSPECHQCRAMRGDMDKLVDDAVGYIGSQDQVLYDAYNTGLNGVTGHLKDIHKLVSAGQFMGIFMALGTGMGVALGAAMDNIGAGIPIGTGMGTALGALLDILAAKDGRVICPQTSRLLNRNFQIAVVVAGLILFGVVTALMLLKL
jgi:hypothetical protein